MSNIDDLQCEFCGNIVKEDDEYCFDCGHLFVDDALCSNHEDIEADGVCVICSYAFCAECGSFRDKIFLCNEHEKYEIINSFARIYGSNDLIQVEYYKNILTEEGMHPVVLDKKSNVVALAGTEYSFFKTPNKLTSPVLNEIKLLIPLQEVLKAEALIAKIIEGEKKEE